MNRKSAIIVLIISAIILFAGSPALAQNPDIDLNEYYRYPLSIGVEYQSYSPFYNFGSLFNIFEVSGSIRVPVPPLPILQPFAKGGMIRFDSFDLENPLKWDNTHWFGGAGLLVSHRIAKNFEIGGDASVSYSHSFFPNLLPEEGTVGAPNIIADAGLRIGLNPSYNFNIEIHPNIKYMYSFSPMTLFNGLSFGIGFSGNFRFGDDPDGAGNIIRSIRFDEVAIPPLFSAMQSYYVSSPAGSLTFTNTERQPIKDIEIVFMQKGFMDSPTPAAVLGELSGGESRTVDIFASFNREIFSTEGITPLTGEIIITYSLGGKPAEQRQSVSYDLHDKTALTWDDDRKVAAFITPADSALRNYTSFVRQSCKEELVPGLSRKLQEAIQIFSALDVLNCLYQIDPRSPFTRVQENTVVVDSISLPRDTLSRLTGDCDDLTVLYCSLLETVGIESGFITVPGHIYSVFNTGEKSRDYSKVHTDRNMMIDIDGELWVPVEITMIGRNGFFEAWLTGVREYRQWDNEPEKRGFYLTGEAQQIYRPVGLKETDLGLQYGSSAEIADRFNTAVDQLARSALQQYRDAAEKAGTAKQYNKLGIMEAKYRQYSEAETSFGKALELDGRYLNAQVNLSSLQYLREDFRSAADGFQRAYDTIRQKGQDRAGTTVKVLLNLSRSYYSMNEYARAEEFFRLAEGLDPDKVKEFSYLADASTSGGDRAAEAAEDEILFLDED